MIRRPLSVGLRLWVAALVLVLVILVLNLTAIFLRHHLRARHGTVPRR